MKIPSKTPITAEQSRAVRFQLGLTQANVIEQSELAGHKLKNFETGRFVPDMAFLQSLREFYESRGIKFNEAETEQTSAVAQKPTPGTCTSADVIAFMLLTGTRVSEACQLTWDRVKLDGDMPTYHLAVTKNHNPVTFPISKALHALLTRRLANLIKGNNYVFPALRGKKGYQSLTGTAKLSRIPKQTSH